MSSGKVSRCSVRFSSIRLTRTARTCLVLVESVYALPRGCNDSMLAGQRQTRSLAECSPQGAVRVKQLTELLAVSEMTVRRDLDALAESGLLQKVHGGATARGHLSAHQPGFESQAEQHAHE